MRRVEYESSVGEIKRRNVPERKEEVSEILLNYQKTIQEEGLKILLSDLFILDVDRYDIYRKNQKIGYLDISNNGTIDTRKVFGVSERNKGVNLGSPIYLLAILQSISRNDSFYSFGAKKDAIKIWERLNELGIAKKAESCTYTINKELVPLLRQASGMDEPLRELSNLILETKIDCLSKIFEK